MTSGHSEDPRRTYPMLPLAAAAFHVVLGHFCLNVLLPALVHHSRTDAVYPGQNMRGEVAGRTEPNFEPEKRGENTEA